MTNPSRPPTFSEAVHAVFFNQEFMSNWRRLRRTDFGLDKLTPIERMIDDATRNPHVLSAPAEEWEVFFRFVRDYVWAPVVVAWVQENCTKG